MIKAVILRVFLRLSTVLYLVAVAGSSAHLEAGPLKMRVSLKDPKVCKGTSRIDVQVEIANTSKEPVTFPLTELGYAYKYAVREERHRPNAGPLNSVLFDSTPMSSEVVTLEPGGVRRFEVSIKFPSDAVAINEQFEFRAILAADRIEKKPEYRKIFKGTVESNLIRFEFSECPAPKS